MTDRKLWDSLSYESRVEKFYGRGVENYGEHHGGYLNFGLWGKGIKNYVSASENLILTLAKSIKLSKNSRLLDVACGLAAQDVFLFKKFGCKIDALDVTWKHVLIGREKIKNAGVEKFVKVHHGSATNRPFLGKKFSHVMGIEGPAHFDTREDFFKEAYRVLKPGGIIGLSDYVIKEYPKTFFKKLFLEVACYLWHAPKENRYTIDIYKKKLEKAGFKNIKIKEIGKYVIPGYYFENSRKETIKSLEKARGYFTAHAGRIIDYVMYKVFMMGIIEYVLVSAEKHK